MTFAEQNASEQREHNRRLGRLTMAIEDVREAMERAVAIASEESLLGRYDARDALDGAEGYLGDWTGTYFDLSAWEGN